MSDTKDNSQSTPSLWARIRSHRAGRWGIDIAIVLVIFSLITAYQTRDLLDGDDPLPPMELVSLDGTTLNLEEIDTRRTIIYFWATWCGACSMQSGAISNLYNREDDDLTIISVVLHYESEEQVRSFVEREEIDYPVYLGTDSQAHRFNVSAFPTVYIIDGDRRIRHGLVGYTTGIGLRARLWL